MDEQRRLRAGIRKPASAVSTAATDATAAEKAPRRIAGEEAAAAGERGEDVTLDPPFR
jgi:hypothetical protein